MVLRVLYKVIYFRVLFCAVLSSPSIRPPELTAGHGENLAPPAEAVGCILSLVLRCPAPSVRSVYGVVQNQGWPGLSW